MLKAALLLGFFSLGMAVPASAAIFRVDVTGSASGFVGGSGPVVLQDLEQDILELVAIGWTLDMEDVADQLFDRDTILSVIRSNTGQAFHSSSGFYDCSGLLTLLCTFSGPGGNNFTYVTSFNATLNSISVDIISGSFGFFRGISVSNAGFSYGDNADPDYRIGNLTYFSVGSGGRQVTGSFDSVTVTAVPVPPAGWLLVASLASLAAYRRQRVRRRAGMDR